MRVYLVRHGIAAARFAGLDDRARALTPEGLEKMRRISAALARLGVKFDEIWTSPLLRARQTAEVLATGPGERALIKTVPALEPGGDFEALRSQLSEHAELDSIALVGHEPSISEFTSRLLGTSSPLVLRFKKGGVALVELDDFKLPVRGELCWFLAPKQMKMMAGL